MANNLVVPMKLSMYVMLSLSLACFAVCGCRKASEHSSTQSPQAQMTTATTQSYVTSQRVPPAAEPARSPAVADFDVKGIKLGMSVDEVRAVFPSLRISAFDGHGSIDPVSGTPMIDLDILFAPQQLGGRVYLVKFTEHPRGDIDGATFAKQLRSDLVSKYGSPSGEWREDNGDYYFFWGTPYVFRSGAASRMWPRQYDAVVPGELSVQASEGNLVDGKYLYVSYTYPVCLLLFDTAPFIKKAQADNAQTIENSRQKVNF